jgi:hypothetical protein
LQEWEDAFADGRIDDVVMALVGIFPTLDVEVSNSERQVAVRS